MVFVGAAGISLAVAGGGRWWICCSGGCLREIRDDGVSQRGASDRVSLPLLLMGFHGLGGILRK